MWSKKYEKCQNCHTQRRSHRARGYCKKCYPIILRLEVVQNWDILKKNTLKYYPFKDNFTKFEQVKKNYVKQLKDHLLSLKNKENKLDSDIDGLDIEYQLDRIAKLAKSTQKQLFHGIANNIDHSFNPEQKKIIYNLLYEIEETAPSEIINYGKLLDIDE